jgi:two-component system NtrC family sensor kinase
VVGVRKPGSGAAVLLVDDDVSFAEIVGMGLEGRGFEVVLAHGGAAARELLRAREVDVVVTDLEMPDATALDVLGMVREHGPQTETIVITGHLDLKIALECMHNGAFDYLAKPFKVADLQSSIIRALAQRKLRATAALYEASRTLLDVRDGQRLPQSICELSKDLLNADDVSLMLPGEGGELYVAYSHALATAVTAESRVPLGARVAGRVAATREPVLLAAGLAADPRFADVESDGRVRSSIVYPLTVGERLIGVLSMSRVANDRPFRPRDLELAGVLSTQVLLALENSRLFHEIVQSARLVSVGQIAASVAHEINNPVAYILSSQGYLVEQLAILGELGQVIERADAEEIRAAFAAMGGLGLIEELQRASADLREGALRVRDIVREIGALARADATTSAVFDLNEAVRSALRVAGMQLRHVATVTDRLGEDVLVRGNQGRLSQVFVNLLVNAGQAFDQRTGNTVTVSSERVGATVVVRIADNGRGITADNLRRVFEAFFTTKPVTAGTGLGLAISREIVRSHGGDICVESQHGRGAEFTISLPYAGATAARTRPPSGRQKTGEVPTPLRLLFVDDEPNIRRGYQRAFAKHHEVMLASDGLEALAVLGAGDDYDVVICDLTMPNMTGMELFERIQVLHPQLVDRVIFVTGGAPTAEAQQFLATTTCPVLAKPFERQELVALIDAHRPARAPSSS